MNKIFLEILNLLNAELKVTEVVLYKEGTFARIDFETDDLVPCKYSIAFTKDESNGNC